MQDASPGIATCMRQAHYANEGDVYNDVEHDSCGRMFVMVMGIIRVTSMGMVSIIMMRALRGVGDHSVKRHVLCPGTRMRV